MPAKIRILSEHVVNQIAAGEVIDRAASALKELIENSVDAEATQIRIAVKGQGTELIQVADDGIGMSRSDLLLAFERHATSKLTGVDDLYQIRSFGFRGEALPSIASVGLLEAQSRSETDNSGTRFRLEGGEISYEEPVAMSRGTTITVRSLFFNTPARAAFLKSPATELAHLVRVFRNYAVALPGISWSFTHESTLETVLPATSFDARIEDLFGAGFKEKLVNFNFEHDRLSVRGVVGKQELNKRSRGDQYLYLNGRPIQSAFLHSAFKAALKEQLEPGEWPFYILFLELDPATVDVNVHPAKLEVRFRDERAVHAAVYHAVRSALPAAINALPVGSVRSELHAEWSGAASAPAAVPTSHQSASALPLDRWHSEGSVLLPSQSPQAPLRVSPSANKADAPTASDEPEFLFRPTMLQAHCKYLIAQIRSGLAIVDQHAAHERILYEKALRSFQDRSFNSQQLLFPMLLELDAEQDSLLGEVSAELRSLGFEIASIGPRAYSIDAIPAGLKRASEMGMINAMLDEYAEFRRANFAPRDALAAGFACKAAIRTGDPLTAEEMAALVDELFATQFPNTCPHGRPTVIHITLGELDRRFKRTE